MKNNTASATLAALMAQVIFGFSFMFTKIALEYTSPPVVIADRYITAFIGLTTVMLVTKTKIRFTKNMWKLIVMSVFQPVMYFLFESYGIKLTTSSFSSVMIALIPVVAMISGIWLLKEVPTVMQYVYALLSVAGVAVMAFAGNAEGTVAPIGIVLLFGAVLSSVAYNIASRKLSAEFNTFERTYAMTVIGLIVFVTIAVAENGGNVQNVIIHFKNMPYTAAILYLGLVSSVVAFLLLNYANTHLPVAKTTVFSNITTVVSVIAGMIFLGEKFSVETAVSTVMIVIGVWGVQRINVREKD